MSVITGDKQEWRSGLAGLLWLQVSAETQPYGPPKSGHKREGKKLGGGA